LARAQPWLDPARPVWQPCPPSQLCLSSFSSRRDLQVPTSLSSPPNNSSTDGTAAFSSSSPRQPTGPKLNVGEISFDPVDPAVRADRREAVSTRKGRRSWQGLNPGSIRPGQSGNRARPANSSFLPSLPSRHRTKSADARSVVTPLLTCPFRRNFQITLAQDQPSRMCIAQYTFTSVLPS